MFLRQRFSATLDTDTPLKCRRAASSSHSEIVKHQVGRLYLAELHLLATVYNLCSFKFILGKSRFPLTETQNSEYLAYFNTWLHIKLPEGQNWANVEISDLKSEKPFKRSRGFVLFNTDESRMCLSEKKVKNERNQSNKMTKIGKSDEKTISCWGKIQGKKKKILKVFLCNSEEMCFYWRLITELNSPALKLRTQFL